MIFSVLSACGKAPEEANGTDPLGNGGDSNITTAAPNTSADAGTTEPGETDVSATKSGGDGTPTESASSVTQKDDGLPKTKKEAIALYAATVDKTLAANKNLTKNVKITIKKPLDGDDNLKKLLKIDVAGFNVEKTVCEFLGEGDETWTLSAKEALQRSYLTESDVSGFSASKDARGNTVLILHVIDCVNPLKFDEGGSPMGRASWDFPNVSSVRQGIKDAEDYLPSLKINIDTVMLYYTQGYAKAVIRPDGSFDSLLHTFQCKVRVEGIEVRFLRLRIGGGEWAGGNGEGFVTFTF